MSNLGDPILRDLREFAEDLLERGIAPQATWQAGASRSRGYSALHKSVTTLVSLLPQLLSTLEEQESLHDADVLGSRTPRNARLSRRPGDYYEHGSLGIVPRRWERVVPRPVPDTTPLRWLLHVADLLKRQVLEHSRRYQKWCNDALIARAGDSTWAEADSAELGGILARLRADSYALEAVERRIQGMAQRTLVPSIKVPHPFPRSKVWRSLLRFTRELEEPTRTLPQHLRSTLAAPVESADLPHLYQRWCGVKVLEEFREAGWQPTGDPIGPLFLGGRVELVRSDVRIDMWVEPRLGPDGRHPSGLRSVGASEAEPDFLFVTPGPHGLDAFVLDPTLATSTDVTDSKSRYLSTICSADLQLVAGSPIYRAPVRSWAASPASRPTCQLSQQLPLGAHGVVPLNPVRYESSPLRSWLRDLTAQASAWGRSD